jgi:hypothetical protein
MSVSQAFLQEFDHEAKTTRRVLERVPADKFSWKPHPKSMSLGELALHTAMTPGMICGWACEDEFKFTGDKPPVAVSIAEILAAHDSSVAKVKETMGQLGDEGLESVGRWADHARDAESRAGPVDRVEPLVSPSRSALGLPAAARRAGPVDLRTERRREPVRRARLTPVW